MAKHKNASKSVGKQPTTASPPGNKSLPSGQTSVVAPSTLSTPQGNQAKPGSNPTSSPTTGAQASLKRAILEAIDKNDDAWGQLSTGKALLIEREGQPLAVVLTYQHFEAILDELEDLQDAQRARAVLDAIRRGEETTIPLDQLEAELRAEGILDD